ncbi:hypothetical protein M231_00071 [Tremella mesenterica]|uniref:GTP-binding protein n=1 Tax=Tremella mesenterica TaxID=5217 RepID=A0A4V1M538_TREME|nr:hypothetical protein M231_00071 [Tremella mesenterica]
MSNLPTAGEPSRPRQQIKPMEDDQKRVKILVLGWRKAGKSSCIKTVFQKVPVRDVAYFSVTQKIEKINYDSIIPLQIWDTPANFELDQLDVPIGSFATIIFVMDMQQDDSYHDAISKFVGIMLRAHLMAPKIKFVVFIHKAEVLSEEYRAENYGEIQRTTVDNLDYFDYPSLQHLATHLDLSDPHVCQGIGDQLTTAQVRFDMTSVHDASLRDAWSKVIQGIMDILPDVESLMMHFTESSGMDNSFLFDINSGVIVGADNRQRNDATLEQVTEYLSRFLQFRELYKNLKMQPEEHESNGVTTEVDNDEEDEEPSDEPSGWWDEEDPSKPWMFQSTRLLPKTTITLWQFTPHLALVALLQTDVWQARRGMIEYNLTFLRQGMRGILMEM